MLHLALGGFLAKHTAMLQSTFELKLCRGQVLSSSLMLLLASWASCQTHSNVALGACMQHAFVCPFSNSLALLQQCDMIFMLWCRDGEESRTYLISCTEAYLEKHPTDGYDPSKSDDNLSWLRPSIDQKALKRDQSLPNGRSHHVSTPKTHLDSPSFHQRHDPPYI